MQRNREKNVNRHEQTWKRSFELHFTHSSSHPLVKLCVCLMHYCVFLDWNYLLLFIESHFEIWNCKWSLSNTFHCTRKVQLNFFSSLCLRTAYARLFTEKSFVHKKSEHKRLCMQKSLFFNSLCKRHIYADFLD